MINTYNETDLHRTLKNIYALEHGGKTEQKSGNWICDIITDTDEIIEIQTANISNLKQKTAFFLSDSRRITIVHPLAVCKTINTYSQNGTILSSRKSPKAETVYSILRGLTGMHEYLLNPNFTLEVLYTEITEERLKTDSPSQLVNKSRHHLKEWVPLNKKLDKITGKTIFKTPEDYLSLIPQTVSETFTVRELETAVFSKDWGAKLSKSNLKKAASQARLLIWLLTKINLVEECGKSGRSKLYRTKK